jgi:hypothetical protein
MIIIICSETAMLQGLALLMTDYAMEGVNVTMFGNNLAMLTYKVTDHGKFAGQTIPPTPFYVGSAYLRRTGRWVNVYTQMTVAKQ